MLVQQEEDAYFNFVNSIDSDITRKKYGVNKNKN